MIPHFIKTNQYWRHIRTRGALLSPFPHFSRVVCAITTCAAGAWLTACLCLGVSVRKRHVTLHLCGQIQLIGCIQATRERFPPGLLQLLSTTPIGPLSVHWCVKTRLMGDIWHLAHPGDITSVLCVSSPMELIYRWADGAVTHTFLSADLLVDSDAAAVEMSACAHSRI